MNQADQDRAFDSLLDFLESGGGEFLGLTKDKVLDRGEIVDDPQRPNLLVIDVERHRAIGGTRYRKGLSMAAFETYNQRVAWNAAAKTLEEIGSYFVDRSFNLFGMASEEMLVGHPVVVLKKGSKSIRIITTANNTGLQFETDSLDEAIREVRDYYSSMDFSGSVIELGDTPAEEARLAQELADLVAEQAVEHVKRDWKEAREE